MTCVSSIANGTNLRRHGCTNSSMDVICPPGQSIPGQLEMFGQTICETSTSAISSPALAGGPSPCAGQDSKERPASGQDHRPASPSPLLEKGLAKPMNGTLPLSGSTSSASASLSSFLGSRLKRQFGSDGSMIYSMRWKNAATPAGRQYCQLVASARRISASACSSERSGWPTPTKTDSERGEKYDPFAPNMTLNMAAQRAGWPTPMAGARATATYNQAGNTDYSRKVEALCGKDVKGRGLNLTGWPPPTAASVTGPGHSGRAGGLNIQSAAVLAGWHTPLARDGDKLDATPPAIEKRMRDGREIGTAMEARMTSVTGWSKHPGPIRITASGQVLTGSDAATASSGQLNPAHSRWLQGFPPEWDACAVTAMQSCPKSRRNSSRNSSAQSPTCKTKG